MNITLTVVVAAIVILITALVVITIFGTPIPSDNVQWVEEWECVDGHVFCCKNVYRGISCHYKGIAIQRDDGSIKEITTIPCEIGYYEDYKNCTKQIKVRVKG